jgi:hypothetical protein
MTDHIEDMDELQVRSFVFNDFLRASDELNELNAPQRRVDTSSWGHPWNHLGRKSGVGTGSGGSAPRLGPDNVPNYSQSRTTRHSRGQGNKGIVGLSPEVVGPSRGAI